MRPRADGGEGLLGAVAAAIGRPLAEAASVVVVEPREYAIRQGEAVTNLYIVGEGVLRAEVMDTLGLPIEVARFGRDDYFGEMAFIQNEPASASIRAITRSTLWAIPHAVLEEATERDPGLMAVFARGLAQRLEQTNERFRAEPPGRMAACLGDEPGAARFFSHAVASGSWHLGRPAIVIDLSGLAGVTGDREFRPAERLCEDPSAFAEVEAWLRGREPGVGVIRGGPEVAGAAGLVTLLSRLRGAGSLVAVFGRHALAGAIVELEELDVRVALQAGDRPLTGVAATLAVVQVRDDGKLMPPGALQHLRSVGKTRTLRSAPDWRPLEGERPPGAAGEPWASVDWMGRHLIGRKVGLALGTGASKAYAHLGVVEELQRMGVPFDYLAATSVGANIANAAAWGFDLSLVPAMLDKSFQRAFRVTFPLHAFFTSRMLFHDLDAYNKRLKFEHMPVPLSVVAVDLRKREEVVFRSGFVTPALVAAMAIPGLFPPVRIDGRTLVDGGLLNPVPTGTVAEAGADVVIGVKLTSGAEAVHGPGRRGLRSRLMPPIVDTIQQAFELMQWRIVAQGHSAGQIAIEPEFSGPAGMRDFQRGAEFIAFGREAAARSRESIQHHLPWVK